MFDFTREISLEPNSQKLYRKLQIALYLGAFFSALYLSYLIIFPHKNFSFSFSNPTARENNINAPHFLGQVTLSNGILAKNSDLIFNTDIANDYSVAKVSLAVANTSSGTPAGLKVAVRRSYEAFMYTAGSPIGWRTGTLLESDGNYYIVSDSKLRKFSSLSIALALGYTEDTFQKVSADDLKYNERGSDITSPIYPDSSLFHIVDNYYILENQTLKKFVSDQAYLTSYDAAEAITKNANFLNTYPLSPDLAGFADGSLISNADSVFIVSAGHVFPIDNPETFIDKGYSWNDVIAAGEDELALYPKAKLFNITTPHPDGTIFKTDDTEKYYLIENGQKHLLPSDKIAASWLKKNPISVSNQALATYADCSPQQNFWDHSTFSCTIPLDRFVNFIGFSYEFDVSSNSQINLTSLSVDYKKNIDKNNLKSFLLNLYNLVKGRYTSS